MVARAQHGEVAPDEDPPIPLPLGKDRVQGSDFFGVGQFLFWKQPSHGTGVQAVPVKAVPVKGVLDCDNPAVAEAYRSNPTYKTRFIKNFKSIISRDYRPAKQTLLKSGSALLFQGGRQMGLAKAGRLIQRSCNLGTPGATFGIWNSTTTGECETFCLNHVPNPLRNMERIPSLPPRSVARPLPGITPYSCDLSLYDSPIQKELFFQGSFLYFPGI
jgi:hypothetical protein